MKPRAIVWDLFGDHLRYIDGGQVQMRALAELLAVFEVGDSTSRVVLSRMRREGCVHHPPRGSADQLRADRPEPPDARRGPGTHLRSRL